jgi:ligand-binding sensor domain-containing protein
MRAALWGGVALWGVAAVAAPGAGAATRLFIVNHVASNDVRHVASWGGRLAVATSGGLVLADTSTGAVTKILSAQSDLPSDNLLTAAESPSGLLWIGTADRGLARLRPDGTLRRTLTSFDGLPTDRVQAIVRAGDSMWVATSGGVALFSEQPANGQFSLRRSDSQASTAGGIVSDDVTSLAVWGDTLWVGTGAGLSSFANGAWIPRTTVTAARVQALTVARDTLWIGTKTGLLLYAGGGVAARGTALETLSLASLGSDVVRGTVAGPFAEEPSGAETFLGTGGLPTPRVQAVVRTPSARIVVGTNAGLAAFAGGATPWLALPIHGPAVNGGSRIEANGAGVWISLGNAVPSGGEIGNALHYDGATWSRISNASSTGNLQSTHRRRDQQPSQPSQPIAAGIHRHDLTAALAVGQHEFNGPDVADGVQQPWHDGEQRRGRQGRHAAHDDDGRRPGRHRVAEHDVAAECRPDARAVAERKAGH